MQELQDKAWRQADEAKKRIEAIGEVSIESESAIVSAREYYDSLSAEVQPLVENYSQLEAAEQIFAQKKEAAQKEAEQNDVPPPKETKKGEGQDLSKMANQIARETKSIGRRMERNITPRGVAPLFRVPR